MLKLPLATLPVITVAERAADMYTWELELIGFTGTRDIFTDCKHT